VAVGRRGLTRNREPVTAELVYDLASLTKLLATTALAMIFFSRGRLDLDQPLADGPLGPSLAPGGQGAHWRRLTPRHLLAHQSGLRPWRPFYRLGGRGADRRALALEALRTENPSAKPGEITVYSDLNFLLMGFLLEELGGAALDVLFEREISAPLGLARTGFRPGPGAVPAPTEDGFRYGGPVGHPEADIKGPTPLGLVHDDNAAWLGGVAGHAGLFAPAAGAWAIAADWVLAWRQGRGLVFERPALAEFLNPVPDITGPGRPLGFNRRGLVSALAGSDWPETAVGHLGYTGSALWWAPERDFLWLFLTNRVHPRAVNPAWRQADYVGGPAWKRIKLGKR
jgi:CubicO group peptidase (beta-lactamase class C family)